MGKLSKIINFLNENDKEIEEEVYNREDQANEQ